MHTTGRTRRRASSERRCEGPGTIGAGRHTEISPVWEVVPQGHDEFGLRKAVLKRDAYLRRGLALVDVVSAYVALVAVITIVHPGRVQLTLGAVLIAPFVVVAAKMIGVYDRDPHVVRKTTLDEAPSLFSLAVVCALSVWLCEAILFNGLLQRAQVFALVLVTFVLMVLGRLLTRRLALAVVAPERCAVIGNTKDAVRIAGKFKDARSVHATVIGRVALPGADQNDSSPDVPHLGDYAALGRIVAEHDVERVIIAPADDDQEEILDAIRLIKALGVKVSVLPRLLEVVGSTSTFDDVDGLWLLGVRQHGLARSSGLLKRSMDIAGAGAGLVVLGPLFLILVLAVKLDSPGPALFRQQRIGRRGNTFSMLKFRSMVEHAEAMQDQMLGLNEAKGGLFKIGADPRITRVGRGLRRWSLDELPQLMNVLRGDMSLVGPRPLVPDEDALIEGWQRHRLTFKPGMTGLWQIFGSSRIPMHEMVNIDYIYGANWSLWLDFRILLRTIPYMIGRRGQ